MSADLQHSLIEQAGQQLELIRSDEMDAEVFRDSEQQGEFTGARLFKQNPDLYRTIISLLAEGLGVIRIGKLLRVSPNTVMAVRDREPEAIDIAKKRIADLARRGAQVCVEGIVEALLDPERRTKVSAKDMAIIAGVLVDKSELLSGGATVRIGHVGDGAQHIDFNEYIEQLRRVGAHECPSMESDAGAREQKGELLPRGSGEPVDAELVPDEADSDSLSGDCVQNTEETSK